MNLLPYTDLTLKAAIPMLSVFFNVYKKKHLQEVYNIATNCIDVSNPTAISLPS